ncbi:desmethyl-deoxy-podophyllotoxin synthase-like [Carex rostrata]
MDYYLSFPILLFSFLLLILLLFKSKTYHSKPSQRFPPGPWPLPIIGNIHNLIGSLPHHRMRELSRQFGPLMLLHLGETRTIVVSSRDAAREIMKTHDINFASRPIGATMDILTFGGKGIGFAPYGEYWRQVRKICTLELLSNRRVQSYKSIREEEVSNLIKSLSSSSSHCQPVNLSKRLASLINDIVARAIFGSKCKNQDMFLQELNNVVKLASGFNLNDLFPSSLLVRLVSTAAKKAERCHQARSGFLDEVIEQHRDGKVAIGEGEVEDLLGVLLRLHDDDTPTNPLDMETVKAVILDLFGAGTETSSATIEWAMSELLRKPTTMKKAQSEVRGLLKGSTHVSESDLDKLNYLHLVIKETLRLHTPLPFLLPRQCRTACRIFDYDIAEGTTVLINVWAIGRDPKYWEDPEDFKPERFMNSSTDFKGNDFEFLPFGSGRRMCAGVSLGLANIELPLASLLYHFDWKLPDGLKPEEIDMSESLGITARKKTPLMLYAVPHETNIGIHGLGSAH